MISQDSRFRKSDGPDLGVYGPILDFSIPNYKLCIELDGWGHNKENDIKRDKQLLEIYKWNTLRFKNEEIENNIEKVINKIIRYINEL
jgi:very-short-patch-repair endonuclease